jgi:acid ceramidase
MHRLVDYHYSEYYQEISGIAEATGIPIDEALMLNYIYEFDSYCSSIIARLSNGTIIHERNLDFYFPNETRVLVYIGKFYDGDEYLFDSVMFAGVVGFSTAFKPGAFSISLN